MQTKLLCIILPAYISGGGELSLGAAGEQRSMRTGDEFCADLEAWWEEKRKSAIQFTSQL